MSKFRDQIIQHEGELPPGTPDTEHWIVYTQKKTGAPFKWAGSLNAPDAELAVQFAGEHYGLDEACVAVLTHHASFANDGPCGIEPLERGDTDGDDGTSWCAFGLPRRGGNLNLLGTVKAPDAATAIERATCQYANGKIVQFRVVPEDKILISDGRGSLIWRLHDMNYKFARGYSKVVREKWTRIRDEEEYEDYRKEDIHRHF
ncbi:MAG: hypothetical protein CMJ40_03520 [Phycisphaerae bacterium]|nr:hypothetical protein [Phycisphaerae bacterium]|tara:strand:+ start:2026 stop:2634 length:609 start_codon:yes stop_codon:yes gene_type:complete